MFIAFLMEGIIYALLLFANSPICFVLLWGLVYFACELPHALYGQGNGRALGPISQRADRSSLKLDGRIPSGIGTKHSRRRCSTGRTC